MVFGVNRPIEFGEEDGLLALARSLAEFAGVQVGKATSIGGCGLPIGDDANVR